MKSDLHKQPNKRNAGRLPLALLLAAACMISGTALAQTVDAELLSAEARVGEPVQFVITTNGKSQGRLLEPLEVEGLTVVSTGDQYQMQMSFPGGIQVTTRMVLTLAASREGRFTIPSLRVRVDGKVFKTQESELNVVQSPAGVRVLPAIPVTPQTQPPAVQQQQQPPPGPPAASRGTFGEMVVPKRTVYVGEVVPVDLRFYVDARLPAQVSERPSFGGEGFTVQRTARPTEANREIDGIQYGCFVYRTAITAAKAGPLEIPPATLAGRVQVPVSAPPGVDDFFGSMMRNFAMNEERPVEIPTDSVEIDVKPLPKEGKPADFSGAVGEFTIQASASPKKAAEGEPITLRVVLSGSGNFEAMGPPVLVEADGWRVYDPSENFQPSASDPIGFNGEKIYEFTMVARQNQRATPPVQFTFFDPSQEKYVTLTAPPIAVDAAGSASATSQTATVATPAPDQSATPPPPSAVGDLARDFNPATFTPLAWSPTLVAAGVVLAGAWALGFLALIFKRYSTSPAAKRAAELRRIRGTLRTLKRPSLADSEFLNDAARFIEERLNGATLDDTNLSAELREAVASILDRQAEGKFSTRSPAKLNAAERDQILQTLHSFDENL